MFVKSLHMKTSARLIIHLTERQLKQMQTVIQNTTQTDLEEETFSGTDIHIAMSQMGNVMEVSGYITEDLGEVVVEILQD